MKDLFYNDIFYSTIKGWLIPKGYVEIYQNHPCAEEREYHFSKDGIRVCCVNSREAYWYLHADILKTATLLGIEKHEVRYTYR